MVVVVVVVVVAVAMLSRFYCGGIKLLDRIWYLANKQTSSFGPPFLFNFLERKWVLV